jgi:hydroxymethylglutaryl-CoA synthase
MTTGILSFGAYIPQRRLQRAAIHAANAWFAPGLKGQARGERAIAGWDEDSVTMAVEAARDALAGIDRATLGSVSLASTTLPFADRSNAGVVKEALALADATGAFDQTGSLRAATSALIQALQAARGGAAPHLVTAAELRRARPASEAEMVQGDAAAAVLVGEGEAIATLVGHHATTIDFVDHFRATGATYDYGWESRWIRDEGFAGLIGDALRQALDRFGVAPGAIDRLVVPIAVKGVAEGLAKKAGIRAEAVADRLIDRVGDSGAAHPLLLLVAALEAAQPGERILLVGFGQGVDVLLFETTPAIAGLAPRRGVAGSLAGGVADGNYLRWLFHRGELGLDRGMRAEFDQKQPATTLWRNRKAVLGLIGGRCTRTGTVQFPRTDISVNPNDHARHTQEDYPLAERRARIVTYTADALTYSPDPPAYYGMIDFDGGGRMVAEFADAGEGDIEVGREMKMVFRIKAFDEQRDFIKYFWKATPVARGENG